MSLNIFTYLLSPLDSKQHKAQQAGYSLSWRPQCEHPPQSWPPRCWSLSGWAWPASVTEYSKPHRPLPPPPRPVNNDVGDHFNKREADFTCSYVPYKCNIWVPLMKLSIFLMKLSKKIVSLRQKHRYLILVGNEERPEKSASWAPWLKSSSRWVRLGHLWASSLRTSTVIRSQGSSRYFRLIPNLKIN